MDQPVFDIAAWGRRGKRLHTPWGGVFGLDEGRRDLPILAILHGFPTSSYDFHRVLLSLAERFRVVIHDHLGFGLSDKPADFGYSLMEQADVALCVWRSLGLKRVHLLAHDYGTSVATELLARREAGLLPIEIDSVTLCNGSVHIELAHLTWAQKALRSPRIGPLFARLGSTRVFRSQMRRIWGDPSKVEKGDIDAMWSLVSLNQGRRRLPQISRYIDERFRFHRRWIGALERLNLPAHILWGRRDPIAVPAIAEKLAGEIRGARLTWLEALGHYPMLESPPEWSAAALEFLLSVPGRRG
ncbi:MAG: alpha/beta hydrolase [Nitrospirae bacterium]|nr:alpha/beta hydrolase [Nitrospirota bacterium]